MIVRLWMVARFQPPTGRLRATKDHAMQSQKEQVEFLTLIPWQSHARSADKLGVGGHWYTRHVSPSMQLSNEIVEKPETRHNRYQESLLLSAFGFRDETSGILSCRQHNNPDSRRQALLTECRAVAPEIANR